MDQIQEDHHQEPGPKVRDPMAVALANASLLGVGYVLMGRRRLAVGTGLVTIVLLLVLTLAAPYVWFQVVVLLWWAAVTAHGWYLAAGRTFTPVAESGSVGRQRLVALGVVVPVLVAVGVLRLDAARIERDAAAAHRAGRCAQALPVLRGLWFGHRVADAPLAARADDSVEACELLVKAERQAVSDRLPATETLRTYGDHPGALWPGVRVRRADLFLAQAAQELGTSLTGDVRALETGFGRLPKVLREFPDQEAKVHAVLDGFLGSLPVGDACDTKALTDWLGRQEGEGGVQKRVTEAVARVAPAAIVGCGDAFATGKDWTHARDQYTQLLKQYPKHPLAAAAKKGAERATLAIELAYVRTILKGPSPVYCDRPAAYHGAPPYRGAGPHRTMLFGNDGHRKKLPRSWLAKDPANAVLVICAGEMTYGNAVTSCYYEPDRGPRRLYKVTFRMRKIPMRVYELRTGKPVDTTSLQISGTFCPARIHYETDDANDNAPPAKMYVKSSKADVRAAYGLVIKP
ncbi:tol-pal system YbgF family protein [Nonomuraea typhae]|uniref:Tol-pal system YbgF family protein n=1 Tax=Nonomuraea typhae TaxID=2603600 RepID=A0ABW7YZX7_9ACTN